MTGQSMLFTPLKIGGHTIKNRIVFGPHRTNFAVENRPGNRHTGYYELRARGGAGLIVIEGGSVHPSDFPYEKAIFTFARGVTASYRSIADAIHRQGSCVIAQLNHCGGQVDSSILSRRETWAPSPVPEITSGEIPRSMELTDIQEVVEGFATAAMGIMEAGLDGVEVNAGQYSLLRQFLSPLTNFRTDDYGGTLENRARFCREVLQRIRDKTGPGFLLGLRICGDEYAPWGGLTPEDCRSIAQYLCRDRTVDFLTVELGSIYSVHMTMASMRYPADYAVHAARLMAEAVDVPVCATGSIVNPGLAESLLHEGIQLVEMTRPLIADPFLPVKAKANKDDQIRPCILCNQECQVHSVMNPLLSCAVNPFAGRETKKMAPARSGKQKKVLVVGGGPAGLEAAGTAAKAGHHVLLCESEGVPGGRLRFAAKIPGCERFQSIINYLHQRAIRSGVNFRMGCQADEGLVAGEAPDIVVLATGSTPSPIPFETDAGVNILRPEDILSGVHKVGSSVAIIDLEGAWQAPGVALAVADRAEKIQFISPEMFISPQLAKNGEFIFWYRQAFQKGIEFRPQTGVRRVTNTCIEVIDRFSRETQYINNIDTIVLVSPNYPNRSLLQKIFNLGMEVWTAGDCVAPRNLGAAVREGREIGLRI